MSDAALAAVGKMLAARGLAAAAWQAVDECLWTSALSDRAARAAVVFLRDDEERDDLLARVQEAVDAAGADGFVAAVTGVDDTRISLEDVWPSGEAPVGGGDAKAALRFFSLKMLERAFFFECAMMRGTKVSVVPPADLAEVAVERLSAMHARDPVARHLFARPGEVLRVAWSLGRDHEQLKRVLDS